MKTADERAKAFVDLHLLTRGMSKDSKRIMVKAIIGLLEDQENITRQSCLNEIDSIKSRFLDDCYPDNNDKTLREIIKQAIINTKAI